MNTTVDKQELIDWIAGLNNSVTLEHIKALKAATESKADFWHELPEDTRKAINKAKTELDGGKGIPHDQVMAEVQGFCF